MCSPKVGEWPTSEQVVMSLRGLCGVAVVRTRGLPRAVRTGRASPRGRGGPGGFPPGFYGQILETQALVSVSRRNTPNVLIT